MRLKKSAVLAAAFLLGAPGTAYAVNVSGNDGNGEQHLVTRYSNGAKVTGSLKATDSYKYVYYAGLVDWGKWWCSTNDVGRYTGNTNSTSGVSIGGTIAYSFPGPCAGGTHVRAKVCRDIYLAPDPCGGWSAFI